MEMAEDTPRLCLCHYFVQTRRMSEPMELSKCFLEFLRQTAIGSVPLRTLLN